MRTPGIFVIGDSISVHYGPHLGDRARPLRKDDPRPPMGSMRDIAISDILATRVGGMCGEKDGVFRLGSSVTGLPGHPVRNVTLDRIRIRTIGGGNLRESAVPDLPEAYTNGRMFGDLPAWGLYCRHVDGLRLDGLDLQVDAADARPPVVLDDAAHVHLGLIRADGDHGQAGPVRWQSPAC